MHNLIKQIMILVGIARIIIDLRKESAYAREKRKIDQTIIGALLRLKNKK